MGVYFINTVLYLLYSLHNGLEIFTFPQIQFNVICFITVYFRTVLATQKNYENSREFPYIPHPVSPIIVSHQIGRKEKRRKNDKFSSLEWESICLVLSLPFKIPSITGHQVDALLTGYSLMIFIGSSLVSFQSVSQYQNHAFREQPKVLASVSISTPRTCKCSA